MSNAKPKQQCSWSDVYDLAINIINITGKNIDPDVDEFMHLYSMMMAAGYVEEMFDLTVVKSLTKEDLKAYEHAKDHARETGRAWLRKQYAKKMQQQ